ncbi:MAG: hypothetical protein ABIF22_00810, partial [bacterium]
LHEPSVSSYARLGWGTGLLSLQEQYRFPIFSNDYILKNMGEPFRVPDESAFKHFLSPTK